VKGDVQGDGGLAHARAGGHDDKLAVIETQDALIKIHKTGGQARQSFFTARQFVQIGIDALHHCAYRHQSAHVPSLPQSVYHTLGSLQHALSLAGALVYHVVYLVGGLGKAPHEGAVPDDGAVFGDIGGGGRNAHKLRHIALGIFLVNASDLHLVQHGHGVYGLAVGEHGKHGVKYVAVLLHVEFRALYFFKDLRDAPGVDEHGAYYCLLRLR